MQGSIYKMPIGLGQPPFIIVIIIQFIIDYIKNLNFPAPILQALDSNDLITDEYLLFININIIQLLINIKLLLKLLIR